MEEEEDTAKEMVSQSMVQPNPRHLISNTFELQGVSVPHYLLVLTHVAGSQMDLYATLLRRTCLPWQDKVLEILSF